MATVVYIPEKKQSPSALRGLIHYCTQEKKVRDGVSGRRLVGGVNCNGENAYNEFMVTKSAYHKLGGINFYQYVQSFSPKENVKAETAHQIALEFAAKAWSRHEVLVTTHCDAEHIHSHFVINAVSFEDGYKLRQSPTTLQELRGVSDSICQAYGLQTLRSYTGGGSNVGGREYHAAMKGESWKFKLMSTINYIMGKSGSRSEFIKQMHSYGYEVLWTDERKNITFTCPNGKKCRDKMLHDEKYLKENIEYELQFRSLRYQLSKQFGRRADQEKFDRAPRNENEPDASYGSHSGERLGYNGQSAAGSSEFSAGDLPIAANPADHFRNERNDEKLVDNRTEDIQPIAQYDGEQAGLPADSSGKSIASDGIQYRTGWEESRKHYEQYLGQRVATGSGNSESLRQDRQEDLAHSHGNISRSNGDVGYAVLSAMGALSGIAEGEEPENEASEVLGTALGLAIGAAISHAENKSVQLPEDLLDEQNEIILRM